MHIKRVKTYIKQTEAHKHVCVCVCVYMYIYIYVYRGRWHGWEAFKLAT